MSRKSKDDWPEEVRRALSGKKPKSGRNKFGAKRTDHAGVTYHSKKEAERAAQLMLLKRSGKIRNLQSQVPFKWREKYQTVSGTVTVDGPICEYIADFVYVEDGKVVVEDVKGYKTREYLRKKRIVESLFNITIKET